MKVALIILVHNSVPCIVKTGKVNTISDEECNAMRRQLLLHTWHITNELVADKFLFLQDSFAVDDIWKRGNYIKRLQRGRGKGEIMMQAFETVFSLGYSKVVMIGSDSIETETTHLIQAFDHLNRCDVVIGPAQETGYYLLGMKKMHPLFFKNKSWNTSLLLQQTLTNISELHLTYHLQQVLNDVEEEKEKYLFQHRQ